MPTLKNIAATPVSQKNPMKIAMESASTFVVSCNQKYTVPTFSKLQLAKRQNYEKSIKVKSQMNNKHKIQSTIFSTYENVTKRHSAFVLSGKTVNVRSSLLRQNTPNFVSEWAELNGIDLTISPKKKEAMEKEQLRK